MARFKVGDKVLVREDLIEWGSYNHCTFVREMSPYKGQICTIREVLCASGPRDRVRYHIEEDPQYWFFSENMLIRPKDNGLFINLAWYV